MAEEMSSSSAWVLMDDECDCGGPPPLFHLPPPPVPPDLPCDTMDMTCPNLLNVSDAEFKRIGSFPSITVIVCCTLLSFVILLVVAALVWKYMRMKKKRKGVAGLHQSKDFDHHHGPTLMNGNGVLYEDLNLTHARPRPPIAPPSIEMMDVGNHQNHQMTMGLGNNNPKIDFSYFLNPPPIYEELPDTHPHHHNEDRGHNGDDDDEFAEDELSVIDVGVAPHHLIHQEDLRFHHQHHQYPGPGRNTAKRAQSLTRKRPSRGSSSSSGGPIMSNGFKSQRSLDRRSRNHALAKYANGSATTNRGATYSAAMDEGNMLILSNPSNGMTMKIPPHLVAVLTESCAANGGGGGGGGGARPYEVIPTSHAGGNPGGLGVNVNGIYPSSRSSGSSYGEGGSSSSSARINPGGNSIESSSFDSGIGPHSITSFINSPAYDQGGMLAPAYAYEYATASGQHHQQGLINPAQYLNSQQHPSFRRLRMTAVDREHPLYSNHLLT